MELKGRQETGTGDEEAVEAIRQRRPWQSATTLSCALPIPLVFMSRREILLS